MHEDEIVILDENLEDNIDVSSENNEDNIDINDENISLVEITYYDDLRNKPQINSVELVGDLSSSELGLQDKGNYANTRVTNIEIDNLFR